jgi:hypothetical protein
MAEPADHPDVTGGEPCTACRTWCAGSERSMSVRVITLGQFLLRPGGGQPSETLLDAG